MNRQRYVIPASKKKPSKAMRVTALIIACILSYFLIKSLMGSQSHTHKETPTETALPLPELPPKITKPEPIAVVSKPELPAPKPLPVLPIPTVAPPPVKPKVKADQWLTVTTRPGDSLAVIFKRIGLSSHILHHVTHDNPHGKQLTHIKPKQVFKFLIKNHQLERMIYEISPSQSIEIVANPGSDYRTIEQKEKRRIEEREQYLTATVQYSLYNTAKRQNIPYKLIQQMMDILKWEMNFAKDVRGGDHFSIIYKATYVDNKLSTIGDIIAVSYTNRGVKHHALRHVDTAGEINYYNPKGQSLKEGFLRYPLKFSRINSHFSMSRMHPVLHYSRPHKGVDLAAPIGTPVYATGDGHVDMMGYESGYGNVIKISHHNQLYTSIYAHLLKFQKGIYRGGYVKRGQVIGFVGQSGLATGPHCHYEFHVNHHPKNPSTVPLPHAMPVPSSDLARFKKNADRLIEHLKLFEQAHLGKNKQSVG